MGNRYYAGKDVTELQKLVHYDRNTGRFTCRVTHKPLRSNMTNGYLRIYIPKHGSVYAHRLAHAMMHGEWPHQIDHINGIKSDNRWCNLREVTNSENQHNAKRRADNTSGFPGVYRLKGKYWHARIMHQGKHYHLGTFTELHDAIEARKAAEQRFGWHPNHGRDEIVGCYIG